MAVFGEGHLDDAWDSHMLDARRSPGFGTRGGLRSRGFGFHTGEPVMGRENPSRPLFSSLNMSFQQQTHTFTNGAYGRPSVAILSGLTACDSRFARLRGKLVTVGKARRAVELFFLFCA